MSIFQNQTGQLKWTTETPNQPGHYWLRQRDDTIDEVAYHKPVMIYANYPYKTDKMVIVFFGSGAEKIETYTNRGDLWAGPIQPPQDKV